MSDQMVPAIPEAETKPPSEPTYAPVNHAERVIETIRDPKLIPGPVVDRLERAISDRRRDDGARRATGAVGRGFGSAT
jgi:hypothetical protein